MLERITNYDMGSVRNKTVLITGATTGIGRAIALMLARSGANIMIVGLDEQHLKDTLKDLYKVAEGEVYDVIADLSTEKGISLVFAAVDNHFGKLDVLVNNVALPFGNTGEGSYKDWQHLLNTNLLSYMACCELAIKRMDGKGHVINIGSMSADVREETGSVYVASKAGIQAFSQALRKKVNKEGIKVTLIEPGAVDTDMQPQTTKEKKRMVEKGEMLTADDIAASVLYCLTLPWRCDVVELQIRPHLQII